MLRMLWTLIGR